jgi:hypothetical protein
MSLRLPTRLAVVLLLGLSSACGASGQSPGPGATGSGGSTASGTAGAGGSVGTGGALAGAGGGAAATGGGAGQRGDNSGGTSGSGPAASGGAGGAAPDDAATEPDMAGGDVGTPPAASGDDTPPARPLHVDDSKPQLFTLKFKPSEADPASSRRDEVQTAIVDTAAKPHRGKLVITLSGVGGAPGPVNVASFAAGLGFHAFAIAYENSVNPSGQNDPKFFGDMRFEEFDGTDRSSALTVARPDCVEVRVAKALAYLQGKNPEGDWGYFLQADGSVRWSDVVFIGHSHGATSAAAFAKIRRVWRAISLSGPRDTNPVVATWLTQPSLTPIDRYFGFTGTADAQHNDHIKAMETMKYVGVLTDVAGASPPYGGSHRLKYAGGHGDSADCGGKYKDVCKYMLGAD